MDRSVRKSARAVQEQGGLVQSEIKEQKKEGTRTWATGWKLESWHGPKLRILKWLQNLLNVGIQESLIKKISFCSI